MITNVQTAPAVVDNGFTGLQKAAVLLIILGDQASAELVKHLSEDEIQLVGREIARLKKITPEQSEGVLEEFYQLTSAHGFIAKGGVDYARTMLMNAFGPETAKRLMDRLLKALGDGMTTFDALQKADPGQLAKFLHNEHPQTIALVLSHLNPSQSAALLASLPPHLRGDVALRVASLDQISPEVISRDRRCHRPEAERDRRIQPRIVRRCARRRRDVQPPRLRNLEGDSRFDRIPGSRLWWKPSGI